MDGFDLHSDGHLVTLFSATNYCGVCRNNGAVIEATWVSGPRPPTPCMLATRARKDQVFGRWRRKPVAFAETTMS